MLLDDFSELSRVQMTKVGPLISARRCKNGGVSGLVLHRNATGEHSEQNVG
jgi:hypothetical protein